MPGCIALNISMPPELAAFVASGRYGTASEVVRTGLRPLQEKEGVPVPGVVEGRLKVLSHGR